MTSPSSEGPAAGLLNFCDECQVEPVPGAAGRYRAELGGAWSAPLHPSGGLVSAVALRAMGLELGHPAQQVRTMTTMFVSMVRSGPVEIQVETLRAGRRMSQLRATVRNAGSEDIGHVTTAAFGERREGFEFTFDDPPKVGPPEQYPLPAEPPPGVVQFRAGFFDQTETRRVRLYHSFEKDWEGGTAEAIRWIRFRVAPRLPDGRLDPLAVVPLADTMPSAVSQYLGPDSPFFHCPSVDLTVHFFAEPASDWLLIRMRAGWAGGGYASAQAEIWDAEGQRVAYATQLMLVRFPEPAELGAG